MADMNLLQQLNQYLLLWGVPGLLVITVIESAAVPMMGGPDAIVLLLAWKRPVQIVPIVLAATVGSTIGCFILYKIARAGGEMALSRFSARRQAWIRRKLDRNAFAAVAAGVAAPPPFPAKFVVLAAGAFNVRTSRFVNGVLVGRLLRYSVLAFLGARFGDQAAEVLEDHFPAFIISLAAILIGYTVLRHFRGQVKDIPSKQIRD